MSGDLTRRPTTGTVVAPVEAIHRADWAAQDYLQGRTPTPGMVAYAAVQAAQDRWWEKAGRPPAWLGGRPRLGKHIKDKLTTPGAPTMPVPMDDAVRAIVVARQLVFLARAFTVQWGLSHQDQVPLDRDIQSASIEAMELIRQGRDGRSVLTALRAAAMNGDTFVESAFREVLKAQGRPRTALERLAELDGAPAPAREVQPEDVAAARRGDGGTFGGVLSSAMHRLAAMDAGDEARQRTDGGRHSFL